MFKLVLANLLRVVGKKIKEFFNSIFYISDTRLFIKIKQRKMFDENIFSSIVIFRLETLFLFTARILTEYSNLPSFSF